MEKASKVMYSIANFFTWIVLIASIVGIVFSTLDMVGILPNHVSEDFFGTGSLIVLIVVLLVSLLTILMVRRAKADNTSKAWDLLFLILGIFGLNIFYILGGLFGLIAPRRK